MVRNRVIALAVVLGLALGSFGWKWAYAGEAAPAAGAHSGPLSTWSAYQPAGALPAALEIDHTPAYDAYEQVYGNPDLN
jgi:hypothetical protein